MQVVGNVAIGVLDLCGIAGSVVEAFVIVVSLVIQWLLAVSHRVGALWIVMMGARAFRQCPRRR